DAPMPRPRRRFALCLALLSLSAAALPLPGQVRVASPDGRTQVTVAVVEGRLTYAVSRDGRPLVLPSRLGFRFADQPPIDSGWAIRDTARRSHDEWWTQPWGEVARVREQYNELAVTVEEGGESPNRPIAQSPGPRHLTLRLRAFDDGIGFRYEFPEHPAFRGFSISEELTEFAFADNPRAWFIPSDRPRM